MCVQQEGILKAGFGDFLGQSPCIDVYKLFFFFKLYLCQSRTTTTTKASS